MPRFFRRTAVVLSLLAAWAYVGSDRAPSALFTGEAVAGPSARSGSEIPRVGEKPAHELSSLKIFTKVILYVKDNYVDPKRIKPKEMMVQALEYVEKTMPDMMVDGDADSGKLKLNVNGKTRDFDISHVDSLWKMSFTLKDVFDFINKNMRPMEDTRDIEYAAVNGMLQTLDPHSILLRPELYREMKLTTKGEFGGLGFVIQMKEGNLTVVRVLPKTPAHRAGIKKDDQIKQIGSESTVNMDLNEAVSKLRGPVDSKVTITVERKGWEKAQPMTLARAMISIESVQHKLLAQNVGYVRLKNFQGNTTRDLQAALRDLNRQATPSGGLKGLVLDMRGNPGGLLEQAIQVSDQFLSHGTIVATVGFSDKLREEKKAHADEADDAYPMAVLINSGSASASEIVAGALKNLNRAVIIGRQSFGKGSVQVLYDFPEEVALKLTIAKYLTPGDVSIQEVGIVPDIALVPTRVTRDRIDVFAPRKSMGEADLEKHFGNGDTVAKKREDVLGREKPLESLKYLKEDTRQKDASARAQLKEEGKDPKVAGKDPKKTPANYNPLLDVDISGMEEGLDDQLDAESQDEIKEDFEVLFARDYVLKAPAKERDAMLKLGQAFVEQKRREEEERINTAISGLGIDWSPGATPSAPQLAASIKPGPERKIAAGELLNLEVTVENKGTEALKRVRGWTESDNPFLDRREFVFGALGPAEKKTWTVPIRLPQDLTSRRDEVKVKLFDEKGQLPEEVAAELSFVELPRPQFAFNWQVLDACAACNGDGLIQKGEKVDLLLDITNTGSGKAMDSFAQIKNAADENIFIEKGRFKLGEVPAGETRTARFVLEVKEAYGEESFPLKVAILDEPLEEFTSEKLELPIAGKKLAVEGKKYTGQVKEKTLVFAAPNDQRPLATLGKAGKLKVLGTVGEFAKVAFEGAEKKPICTRDRDTEAQALDCQPSPPLSADRFAFVRSSDLKATSGGAAQPKELTYHSSRTPPQIQLSVDPLNGGVVADGERFRISGTVSDPQGLLDIYVLVNDQKVFFQGTDPNAKADQKATLSFTTDFALKEGNNTVLVVARETSDFSARKTLVIRRRPPAVAQQLNEKQTQAKPQ